MSLKNILSCLLKINFIFIFLVSFLNFNQKVQAQYGFTGGVQAQASLGGGYVGGMGGAGYGGQGQWGTGMWGGQQGCGYNQRVGGGAFDMSDDEKELRGKISSLEIDLKKRKAEKAAHDRKMENSRKFLEKIFDSEVLEFVLDTHIENSYQCSKYCYPSKGSVPSQVVSKGSLSSQAVDADGRAITNVESDCSSVSVAKKLIANWNQGKNYCAANSVADGGKVSESMCADESLRNTEEKRNMSRFSAKECNKYLTEYRKNKILSENAQAKVDRATDDLGARRDAISDARTRAKIEREERLRNQTESDYCPECEEASRGYSYQKPKRDWLSIVGQVGLGLGLGMIGKRYDEAAMEYQAQLGYPPQQGYPTAISMGAPYVLGGVYGAIYGTQGQGGFGCSGQGGFGLGNGAYGPYGPQGAFGYPQGTFGAPWGGGMYPPGMYPGGVMGGPNGGAMCYPGIAGGMICPGGGGGIGGAIAMNGYMNGPMSGYPMPGGGGIGGVINGGIAMNGYMNGPMSGYPMPGGGGYPMPGGGGYPMPGGGGAISVGGAIGAFMNNPQYLQMQQQQLQMQLQMQQQQQQMQQQYYQAQMQAQMQAYQRQQAIQQQAMQVQSEIAQLQMRLQMLYSGASFSGGGYYGVGSGGGSIGGGGSYGSAAPTPGTGSYVNTNGSAQPYYPSGGNVQPYYPSSGTAQPTNPNPGTGGGQVTIPRPAGR